MKSKVTFDSNNPDKKFIKMVLHQAFPYGGASGLKEIYAEAWCLRDMSVKDWDALQKYLLDNKLIEDSGEREYFRLTSKGESFQG